MIISVIGSIYRNNEIFSRILGVRIDKGKILLKIILSRLLLNPPIMKYLLLGLLIYILYRLVTKPKSLDGTPMEENPIQEPEQEGFVEYEELE